MIHTPLQLVAAMRQFVVCQPYSKMPHEVGAFGKCSFIFYRFARVCMGERSPLLYISRHVVSVRGVQTCRLTGKYDVKLFA